MRILGVLLQSKKGDPLVLASSPSLLTRTIILYSNIIYNNILENYRRRQKIQRCIVLQYNLQCVLTISKEYMFYVYINKGQLGIAFDGIKKVTQYFNTSGLKMFQGAKTGAIKMDIVQKKFVELDFELFNKFSHLNQQSDKRVILQMSTSARKIAKLQVKKRIKIVEHMKKFSIKNQDELDLLETDPKKQKFLVNYKKNLINFACCGKGGKERGMMSIFGEKQVGVGDSNNNSLNKLKKTRTLTTGNNFFIEEQILQQTIIEREKINIKLMQKLQLHLFQGKIKQVLQFGQVLIQGTQAQTAMLNLINPNQYWKNSKTMNKRISPNSVTIKQISPQQYQFTTSANYKSKPLLDYIIRKQTFIPDKIPLLFVYTMDVRSSNIEFVFKYKINDKWKQPLTDIEICVYLNSQFMVSGDCHTIPMAVSLRNHKIIWKTKQISHSTSSKGKIVLAFTSSNIAPKKIIKQIKLTMKCPNKGMLDGLAVECCQEDDQVGRPDKLLLINYKVLPNQ